MAKSNSGQSLEQRKARLKQLLHVGRSKLGWDEEMYRQVLVSVSRDPARNSSTQLTLQELDLVLDKMRAAGFKPKKAGTGSKPADDARSRKARSLWLQLRDKGALRDPSEAGLNAWVKREVGVDNLAWLTQEQSHQVIERLKQWVQRLEVQHG